MVNVFVPVPDFAGSCAILDQQRLGKQRSEIKIILAANTGVRFKKAQGEFALELPEKRGYMNHAAARMWRGHEAALALFGWINCIQWSENGGKGGEDTKQDMIDWLEWLVDNGNDPHDPPEWWGREDVHASHRSVLLSKDPVYYGKFGWTEEPKYEYVWPV